MIHTYISSIYKELLHQERSAYEKTTNKHKKTSSSSRNQKTMAESDWIQMSLESLFEYTYRVWLSYVNAEFVPGMWSSPGGAAMEKVRLAPDWSSLMELGSCRQVMSDAERRLARPDIVLIWYDIVVPSTILQSETHISAINIMRKFYQVKNFGNLTPVISR